MIEIVSPVADEWGLFSDIIPTEKIIPSGSKILYAAIEDSDEKTDVCGVLIIDFEFAIYQIDYLYVVPEYRRKGIATLLVNNFIDHINKYPDETDLAIDLNITGESAGLCYFFANRDDFDMTEGALKYRVYAGSLNSYPKICKMTESFHGSSGIRLLSECSEKNWNHYITELNHNGLEFVSELKKDDLDEHLSQFYTDEDGRPLALLAVQKPEGNLIRVLFLGSISKNASHLTYLLASAFTEYKKLYEKMYFEFILTNPQMEKPILYMFEDYALGIRETRFIYNWNLGTIPEEIPE